MPPSTESIRIAPSILSADFARLDREIALVEEAGADMLHVDVMDGHFVPNITVGPLVVEAVRKVTELPIDAHLMIADPDTYAPRFADAGADYITFHSEVSADPARVIDRIRQLGASPGLAINPKNGAEPLRPHLDSVDLILLMTVEPGFGGQAFMEEVMPKLSEVAAWKRELGLGFLIQVDGGISRDTAGTAVSNGAEVLVAGSAIYRSEDPAAELRAIREAGLRAARAKMR